MKRQEKQVLTRLTALLLATLLMVSLLAGCGANTGDRSEPEKSPSVSSALPESSAPGKPSDTPVTLKAVVRVNNLMTMEVSDLPSIQGIEEKTGIHVEWETYNSGESWNERKNLVLAGGDLPDMFFGVTLKAADVVNNKDLFTDLSPLLEQAPNVQKMFEEEPGMKNMVTMEDGAMMFLPSRMPLRPKALTNVFINKDWLDTLNLSVPTTTEEFTAVLEAFRDQDPNRNGVQDEIPMSGDGSYDNSALTALLGAFGVTLNEFSSQNELLMIRDGALHFVPTMEEYKECVSYLSELFEKGLIDSEAFTQDWNQYYAKCASTDPQLVGVASAWTISSGVGTENLNSYATMAPLKGPHGDQKWSSNPLALSTLQCSWALTKSCENKEAAMKYINEFYDPETGVQFYFGSYGVSLEKQDDGTVKVLESGDPEVSFDSWLWMNGFGSNGPYYVSQEFDKKLIPNSWAKEKMDIDEIYAPYITSEEEIYPTMFYSPEDTSELSILQTDIKNITDQNFARWVGGEGDIDAEWDDYLTSLENVGLPRAMEIYNKYWENSKN